MLFERKVLIVTQWHGSSNRKLKISAVSNNVKSPEAELYIAILFRAFPGTEKKKDPGTRLGFLRSSEKLIEDPSFVP